MQFDTKLFYCRLLNILEVILGEQNARTVLFKGLISFGYPLWHSIYRGNQIYHSTSTTNLEGLSFTYRPKILSDMIMVFTDWEPNVRKVFNPQEGDVVVDVGAHIGFYTLIAAKRVGNKGKVFAIEPDPRNYETLIKNIELNKLRNVIALNIALGNSERYENFYAFTDPLFSSFAYSRRALARHAKATKVRVSTLDKLLKIMNVSKVDWLKIDVESSDLSVVKGASSSLETSISKIIIEATNNKTLELLRTKGFRLKKLAIGYYFAEKSKDLGFPKEQILS